MRSIYASAAFLLLQTACCSARSTILDISTPMATATIPSTTASKTTTTFGRNPSALTSPGLGATAPPRGGDAPSEEKPVALMSQTVLVRVGCVLAANSGFINGLALGGKLVASKQAVAAVTGAWTTSAVAASTKSYPIMTTQMSVMASYFGGSMINGLLNPTAEVDWDSPKAKAPASALLVSAAFVLAAYEYLSRSANADSASPLLVWCLLAIANGVQNSWTSMLIGGNVLRTAHFSGITSDMGSFVGQMLGGGNKNAWKLPIFAALAGSFWSGGALSVFCAEKWGGVNCLAVSVGVYLALYAFFSSFNSKR
eukprot:CAMPEP_0172557358 /NCGR_PEP_ID=MMETSP1067-20121228/72806_1 /TAXON_ID=265564 ORGANISM="Thalassiosira punctigera, Strain Tpunct2005C2" /NCGR_SAMPLE_ID=MMETSP1067 /ASSEMBLY_ACC=CAM_ASM_000444 /LENGTH=311 /DNA_ID=CAMNT_0013346419 /DNA_START=81 /DNA_END=1016 /DNA_ORIENTATION=-